MSHLQKDVRNEDGALKEGKINSPVPLFDETSTTSWPAVEVFIDTDESQNGEKSADKEHSSDIWSVFTRIDDALAKCNLCEVELSCKDSIADLTTHREVEHLGVLLKCDSSEDELAGNGLHDIPAEENCSATPQNSKDSSSTDESQNGVKSADKEQSSDIWSVFTRIDDALAKCNLCQIELSCKDSIADLTTHREVEHLGVLLKCDSSENELVTNGLHDIPAEENCSATPQSSKDSSSNDESQNGEKSADKEQSSDIWSVFTRIDDSLAKCNLCQIELSCKDSIADLTTHREVEHLGVLLKCVSSENEAEKCEDEDSVSQPQDQSTVSDVEAGSEGENSEKVNKSRKNTSDAQGSDKSPDLHPSKRKKMENPLVEIELEEVSTDKNLQSSQNQNSVLENYTATGVDYRRGPRSFIWKMFTKLKNGCPQCKICGVIMSKKSEVSNLRRHIRQAHPSCKSAIENVDSSSYAWKMFTQLKNGCSQCKVCGALMSEKASLDSLMRHVKAHPSFKYAMQKKDAASGAVMENGPGGKSERSAPIIHTFETAARLDGESAQPRTAGGASGSKRLPNPPEERNGTFRNVRAGCLFSERSVLAVEERNHLLRDLQNAMERQGQVLDRIVACLEGMSRLQRNDS